MKKKRFHNTVFHIHIHIHVQWNPLINMSRLLDKKMLIAGRCYKASDNILLKMLTRNQ